jgi:Endonuclease NucS
MSRKIPTAPANLTATPGDRQVSLHWMPSAKANTYSVYRRPASVRQGDDRLIRAESRETIFTDTGLTNGSPYRYVVRGWNASGESAPSNEVSATPRRKQVRLWKVYAMEDSFPGLWHQWYRHQCAAVGFAPYWGSKLRGKTKDFGGWRLARARLLQIAVGDFVIVALKGNRVGRLGEVTGIHIEDDEWDPLVPASKDKPTGEMGRRIHVRWDLTCGPDDRDLVVALPEGSRFNGGELLPTIAEIRSQTPKQLRAAMNDPTNWVGLLALFKTEKALSDYIAAYPHHLEDGLVPYPNAKVREKVFTDHTRLDVLLLDRKETPVVVECKQGAPTAENLKQLRGYMKLLQKETGRQDIRGILVHGGARKVRSEVVRAANLTPRVELVQYRLQVDFAGSSCG